MYRVDNHSFLIILFLSSLLMMLALAAITMHVRARRTSSKSCLAGAWFFTLQFIGLLGIVLTAVIAKNTEKPFERVLEPWPLISVLPVFLLMFVYIMEIKRPGWTNYRRLLMMAGPLAAVSLAIIFSPGFGNPMYSIGEIASGFNANIALRILLYLMIFGYAVIVGCIPYDWRKCGISGKAIHTASVITIIFPITFVLGLGMGILAFVVIHTVLVILSDALIIYIESFVKMPAKEEASVTVQTQDIETKQLHPFFDDPEIWMNPDITASDLAKRMGTNLKYLSNEIKTLGYTGFRDMINSKRVGYICSVLDGQGKIGKINITQVLFDAGFRSRSTANSEFKRITGCTPSEYQKAKE